MECGFVKRIKPGAPQEQVGELQVASENHPYDAQCKNDEVGEASIADNLSNRKERKRSDGENHHLSIVTAVNVSEIFRRERVKESEERAPPFIAGQVPSEEHGAHERHPDGQDELETDSARWVHQKLRPHQRVVSIGEQSVHCRDSAQTAIVPFRENHVECAQNAAADAVQLVAVEHELAGIECEIAENNQQNREENCGHGHKESWLLIQKIHIRKYKNTAEVARCGLLNCLALNETFSNELLFERVFVGLCRLYQTVDAKCRDDANSNEDRVLNEFSHKFLLGIFLVKIFDFL